jgi:hypothetical protein
LKIRLSSLTSPSRRPSTRLSKFELCSAGYKTFKDISYEFL